MSQDPKDTQPFAGPLERTHREYIKARWKPLGEGGGHPKIDGGFEVDRRTGEVLATRGLNNVDQRYTLPHADLISRRQARAAAELSTCVIVQDAGGRVDFRAPSGNNYDVLPDGTKCDCPDRWRLDQSGATEVLCKHGYAVLIAIANVGGYANLPWGTGKIAEVLGIAENTAANLCKQGLIPAVLVHKVWVAEIGIPLDTAIADYAAKIITFPNAIG